MIVEVIIIVAYVEDAQWFSQFVHYYSHSQCKMRWNKTDKHIFLRRERNTRATIYNLETDLGDTILSLLQDNGDDRLMIIFVFCIILVDAKRISMNGHKSYMKMNLI